MKQRVTKIFETLAVQHNQQVNAIIIKNGVEPFIDQNFFYVTGLHQGLFEGCAAILFPDGKIQLLVSSLEAETARKSNHSITTYSSKKEFLECLREFLQSASVIGVNNAGLLHKDYLLLTDAFPEATFIDVSPVLKKVRMIKDEEEIKIIKQACRIADNVMIQIPDLVKEGMTENELAAEIDYLLMKHGAQRPAFETIASFGENTAEPHYSHGQRRLQWGDMILCDFGAFLNGYHSDITRTFVFGSANEPQKKMHQTVLAAQEKGFQMIKPGVQGRQVHEAVKNVIDQTSFAGRFIHATGHALGLSVHDGGVGFTPDCEVILAENMVLTVEPGVYIPKQGGVRIEDDVVITRDGVELLTCSPRDLIEI